MHLVTHWQRLLKFIDKNERGFFFFFLVMCVNKF